jgi:methylenetetrahydrofolate reductase (NADPH)
MIYDTLDGLKGLNPDFISVTYGAGGSEMNTATLEIASSIKNHYGIESVAHLPCINLTKSEVLELLDGFRQAGIENILALRGDINPDFIPKQDFRYASELVSFIKENGDFNMIGVYPEGHNESAVWPDIRILSKVDAGTDQLITSCSLTTILLFNPEQTRSSDRLPIQQGICRCNKKQSRDGNSLGEAARKS